MGANTYQSVHQPTVIPVSSFNNIRVTQLSNSTRTCLTKEFKKILTSRATPPDSRAVFEAVSLTPGDTKTSCKGKHVEKVSVSNIKSKPDIYDLTQGW